MDLLGNDRASRKIIRDGNEGYNQQTEGREVSQGV